MLSCHNAHASDTVKKHQQNLVAMLSCHNARTSDSVKKTPIESSGHA